MAKRKNAEGEVDTSAVQDAMDAALEKGYVGVKADPTPNESYTVEGVTSGAPTPETDQEAHETARARLRAGRFGGAALPRED